MKQRMKDRLDALEIALHPWEDKWDSLAVKWILNSDPGRKHNPDQILDSFRFLKENPSNTFLTITSKNKPIGIAGLVNHNSINRSVDCHLMLDETMTYKGIGRFVAEKTFDILFQQGYESLTTQNPSNNRAAVNAAKRLGFEETGLVPMVLTKEKWMNR